MAKTPQKRTCCGVITEAKYQAREKRANRTKPQPWIVLKLSIGITVGLIGYAGYVYIGRLAIPMIRRDGGALGGRTLGIVFVAVFSMLLLMTLWTYEKVVLTSPGKAKEHVRRSSQPGLPGRLSHQTWDSSNIAGRSYEDMHPTVDLSRQVTIAEPPQSAVSSKSYGRQRDFHAPNLARHESRPSHSSRNEPDTGTPQNSITHMVNNKRSRHTQKRTRTASPPDLPPPQHSRRPPTTPVLLPEFRYCYKDELLKPPRAHHCRACGTCIMKYDHHCPWIGQCVGARNHKFFVNFLQWASVFCLWVFSTMVALNVKSSSHFGFDIDPQHIVIIAIAGLFSIFATVLLATHIRLVMLNQTTVESLAFQAMQDRERETLARLHPWYSFGAKRRTKKQWDVEWGKISSEGNLWWLGSRRANWEAVMGKNVWWWFLPIGRSSGDGTVYPTNPRFDEQGRWRRRKEWPIELQ